MTDWEEDEVVVDDVVVDLHVGEDCEEQISIEKSFALEGYVVIGD